MALIVYECNTILVLLAVGSEFHFFAVIGH